MDWAVTLYVVCIGFGLVYAICMLLFSDILGHWLGHIEIPVLQPVTLVSGVTAFGGSGLLLTQASSFSPEMIMLLAVVAGAAIAVLSYFVWVEPMERAETTIGYSIQELVGQTGEVLTAIPADGVGEILITMVSGRSNHIAASMTNSPIPEGARVIVLKVSDHVLYVERLEEREGLQ